MSGICGGTLAILTDVPYTATARCYCRHDMTVMFVLSLSLSAGTKAS
jgi:hypothetical protein